MAQSNCPLHQHQLGCFHDLCHCRIHVLWLQGTIKSIYEFWWRRCYRQRGSICARLQHDIQHPVSWSSHKTDSSWHRCWWNLQLEWAFILRVKPSRNHWASKLPLSSLPISNTTLLHLCCSSLSWAWASLCGPSESCTLWSAVLQLPRFLTSYPQQRTWSHAGVSTISHPLHSPLLRPWQWLQRFPANTAMNSNHLFLLLLSMHSLAPLHRACYPALPRTIAILTTTKRIFPQSTAERLYRTTTTANAMRTASWLQKACSVQR